jgi:hypothetical protein
MTALFDQPNLPTADIRDMLAMALPALKLAYGFVYSLQVKKRIGCVFIEYFPNALSHHRWQVEEIYQNCENYRHTRKDGSYGNVTKRYTKRFSGLIDALTYIEKEFN